MLVLAAVAWTLPVRAADTGTDKIRITVVKKTADSRVEGVGRGGRTDIQRRDSQVFYKIDLQRLSPQVPENLTVQWIAVVDGRRDGLNAAAHGEEEIVLTAAHPASLETKPVDVNTVEFSGRHSGAMGDEAYGYALRIHDDKGTLVAEKYLPKDLAAKAAKWFADIDQGTLEASDGKGGLSPEKIQRIKERLGRERGWGPSGGGRGADRKGK